MDSIFRPVFSTRATKKGKFAFDYLPTDSFQLIVFEDLNFNKIWDTASEPVGLGGTLMPALDTPIQHVEILTNEYVYPILDSAVADSIKAVIDTTDDKGLGLLQLGIPPHAYPWRLWVTGSNGYYLELSHESARDSALVDLP